MACQRNFLNKLNKFSMHIILQELATK